MTGLFVNDSWVNKALKGYLAKRLACYGDFSFAYMVLNKRNPADMVVISNYPDEWVTIYTANHYQHIDPVILTALKSIAPFPWDENLTININLTLSKVFNHSQQYRITNGYTFVLHDHHHHLITLSLMLGKESALDAEEQIINNRDKIQMLLISTYEKNITLCNEVIKNSQPRIFSEKDIFTHRENEILYWASMGKTYQEISLIITLKVSTVKFHMGNVVRKLGVLNAKHAIRLGVELQLIKPVLK